MRNPLDPFLNKLAREYVDDDDLTSKMHGYFQVKDQGLELLKLPINQPLQKQPKPNKSAPRLHSTLANHREGQQRTLAGLVRPRTYAHSVCTICPKHTADRAQCAPIED